MLNFWFNIKRDLHQKLYKFEILTKEYSQFMVMGPDYRINQKCFLWLPSMNDKIPPGNH